LEEAKEDTKQSEATVRMWESLASKAHQVPPVLKGLNEGISILMEKVDKKRYILLCKECTMLFVMATETWSLYN